MKEYFMSANNHSSFNETTDLFNSESNKLQDGVSQALKNSEKLSISEIIEAYYQVTNVTSLAKFLRQDFEDIKNTEEDFEKAWISYSPKEAFEIIRKRLFSGKKKNSLNL